jgi:curved DNA-binding protein CbpA
MSSRKPVLPIKQPGPVVRTRGLMTGGNLERTPAAELFRTIYRDRMTASLLLSHRSEERTFLFDRGQLLLASSNREAQLVGEMLRIFGLADETLLLSAFERALAEPGRGLAKALSESGAVPGFIAEAAVRALAERIYLDTYRWPSGVFTLTPVENTPDVPVRFDRTNGSIAIEALRRMSPQASIGPMPDPRSKPVLHADLLLRYQAIAISEEEADVLVLVDGVRTAQEIASDPRVLARLAAVGLVQYTQRSETEGIAVERTSAPEGLSSLNVEVVGWPLPPRTAETYEAQANAIWNTYRRIDWSSHYEILGVERDAPLDAVNRAVHERARLFHPDHHLKAHLADARDALEALFQRVRVAERTFRSEETRAKYDVSLAAKSDAIALPGEGHNLDLQKEIAKSNYTRAKALFEEQDYFSAYSMVRQSVEFDPEQKEYWILLSRVQRKNPKWLRQSADTMRRAVARIPASVELLWELSEAAAAERNPAECTRALREILKIDAGNRRAQVALKELEKKESSKS